MKTTLTLFLFAMLPIALCAPDSPNDRRALLTQQARDERGALEECECIAEPEHPSWADVDANFYALQACRYALQSCGCLEERTSR